MPELPEAEANRARAQAGALNRTITGISIHDSQPMDMPSPSERRRFEGTQLTETRRHGKYIFLGSKGGPWLAVHLGMSGSLRVWDEGAEDAEYIKLLVNFEGERRLGFRCPRKFGWVKAVDDPDAYVADHDLGPDALETGRETFAERVLKGKGAVKSALLNQKRMAGVGNLWSDEALYRVGLLPDVPAGGLGDNRAAALHDAVREVLKGVVATGAEYSQLPDDWLIHHREEGAKCPRCGGTITSKKVGGRTAYHCPAHQEGA